MAKSSGGCLSANDLILLKFTDYLQKKNIDFCIFIFLSASDVYSIVLAAIVLLNFLSAIVLVSLVIFAEVYLKAVSIAYSF